MPRSAPSSAASSSSIDSAVSRGERVTMRLISDVSLSCVFASPSLTFLKKPNIGSRISDCRFQNGVMAGIPPLHDCFLHLFHAPVGQLDPADERTSLAQAVAIRSAGRQQPGLLRHFQ